MKKLYTILMVLLSTFSLTAQQYLSFKPSIVKNTTIQLDRKFKDYSCYQFDPNAFLQELASSNSNYREITIELDQVQTTFALFEYEMFKPSFQYKEGDQKVQGKLPFHIRTFRGYNLINQKEDIALTVGDDFANLMFQSEGENYYFELDPTNINSNFVLYKAKDVIPIPGVLCGAEEGEHKKQELGSKILQTRNRGCKEVEVGLTCDFTFVTAHKNAGGATNQMLAILNLAQLDYFKPFYVDLPFFVTEVVVPPSAMMDPFRNANDIMVELNTFIQVQSSIFTQSYDIAACWTAKFTSGIVGLATGIGTVCGPFPLCINSEFTSSTNELRQLNSHEFGHDFGSVHDASGSPFIMAPVINGSNVWSGNSILSINTYIGRNGGCLTDCAGYEIPVADFTGDPLSGCAPVVVQFTNQSSNSNAWKWKFPGGMPDSSSMQNPVVTYKKKGNYDVTLEAFSPKCSNKITKTFYIEVKDNPIPDFDYGFTDKYVGFINLTQFGIDYVWDFGDKSGTSTEDSPYHEYLKDGIYTVMLTATNECGTVSITKKIEIYSYPTIDFTSDTIGGCAPKTIKFFDQSSDNVTGWQWTFKGGKPAASSVKNPVITYTKKGIYDVELRVTTPKYSTSLIKKIYVNIDSAPIAHFNYVVNGYNVDFTSNSTYSKSQKWYFGDGGTSTDSNTTHTYTDGVFNVVYITYNDCGIDSLKQKIEVGGKPIAAFNAIQNGCVPYSVTFHNQSSVNSADFKWYFPGGNPSTSTQRDPTVIYNSPGKYDVSLVAVNVNSQDSISYLNYIFVNEKPKADYNSAVQGLKVLFTNLSNLGTSYLWDFGNGKTSTEPSPNFDYGQEGEFLVKLSVTNECGTTQIEKRIAVYLVPKVNFAADTIRGCAPFNAHFNDKSSIDVFDWNWQFESGTPLNSTMKNPSVRYIKPGNYTVKLTVKNTNGTNSTTKVKYVEVISPVLCPKTNPKKKTGNDPDDDSAVQLDDRSSGSNQDVYIYPNPTRDLLNIDLYINNQLHTSLKMYSMTGELILQQNLQSGLNTISTSQIRSGSYIIKIANEEMNELRKIAILN